MTMESKKKKNSNQTMESVTTFGRVTFNSATHRQQTDRQTNHLRRRRADVDDVRWSHQSVQPTESLEQSRSINSWPFLFSRIVASVAALEPYPTIGHRQESTTAIEESRER